jgi:hypothetical protein
MTSAIGLPSRSTEIVDEITRQETAYNSMLRSFQVTSLLPGVNVYVHDLLILVTVMLLMRANRRAGASVNNVLCS